jgi:hypothetical protein
MVSHFGTSDSGYYVTPYAMGGEVSERRETYDRLSPVRWLEHATTPTLLLQGEDDHRCPVERDVGVRPAVEVDPQRARSRRRQNCRYEPASRHPCWKFRGR